MKTSNKYLLCIIFVFGLLIRLYYAYYSRVEADEAYYLYDAYLHLKGETPFLNYFTRAPLLLYILSIFIKIFGSSVLAGRYLSLISSMVTILLTYKIGNKLYGSNTGLLASFIFAFSPFIIWWGRPIITEPIQLMFITAAMYMLILGIESNKNKYYLFNGIFLIFAILIRQSTAIFLLTEAMLLIVVYRNPTCVTSFKFVIKKFCIVIIGFMLPIIPAIMYLSFKNDILSKIFFQYNPVKLLQSMYSIKYIQTISTISNLSFYLLMLSALFIVITLKGFIAEKYRSWYHIYMAGVGLIALGIVLQDTVSDKLIDLFLMKFIIIPLILILLSLETYISEKTSKKSGFFYTVSIYMIGLLYLLITLHDIRLNQDSYKFFLVFIYISLSSLSIILLRHDVRIEEKMNFANVFLLFWFFSIFIFYLTYKRWEVVYFYEYSTVVSIMSSAVLYSLYKTVPNRTISAVFIVLLVISALNSPYVYNLNYNPSSEIAGNAQPLPLVREVAEYIAQNTTKDDEIFTAWPVYAFQADRRVPFDIVRSLAYNENMTTSMSYTNMSRLITYLGENRIKYVVIDPIYMNLYMFRKNPELKNFVYSNYHFEKKIGNVEIFALNTYVHIDQPNRFQMNTYSDNFDTEQWKSDSFIVYGIDKSINTVMANETVLYPTIKDQTTYIRYIFNFSNTAERVLLTVNGTRRELVHNFSVWVSPDNSTYTKVIEFEITAIESKNADITKYIQNNQTFIEFRFNRSSKGTNIPRILDFSVDAIAKNNESMEIIPYKKNEQTVSSSKILYYDPVNLLTEPSFEHYKDSDNTPIAWSFTSNNGGISQIDDTGFDGNYSYLVNVTNALSGTVDMSQTIDIGDTASYSFSTAYMQSGSGDAIVLIQWLDENWNKISEDEFDLTYSNVWNNISFELEIPTATKHSRVILRYLTNKGDNGAVWFDDVRFYSTKED